MKYAEFKENIKLSKLGLGAMRLPQTEPGLAKPVDEPKARELIDYCMAHGVNYYDTAYIYHGGKSETILGRALSGYPRDSYYVCGTSIKSAQLQPGNIYLTFPGALSSGFLSTTIPFLQNCR